MSTYPEVRTIRYPRAGAPIPVVRLQIYDMNRREVFTVVVPGDFPDKDRLIVQVLWLSHTDLLVRETNRQSDVLKVLLINVERRSGKLIRCHDMEDLDGGWIEPVQSMLRVPADPENGRRDDGYLDIVIEDDHEHIAYFAPADTVTPLILTSGQWDVARLAEVDLMSNRVYFVATKEGPAQRHIYSVQLDGKDLRPVTDVSAPGYYEISFSKGTKYALLNYLGPNVPWQGIIRMGVKTARLVKMVERNTALKRKVSSYALPEKVHQTVTVDGHRLQVLEYRPPNLDVEKKYPVLFHVYGGPGSQMVDYKFKIDYHSYLASALDYLVVIVDGRGTGHLGRHAKCLVRGRLGRYEATDQLETAKLWAQKTYVDSSRMAIWGWSYGGFISLKVLEKDAGRTFKYGMAVAPVTDWRLYGGVPS